MRRGIVLAVLSLLLLSMQHQGYVHPLTHLADRGAAPQETVVASPHLDADCVECALLAGGLTSLHGISHGDAAEAPVASLILHAHHSRAAEVPAWFESRAPPVLV